MSIKKLPVSVLLTNLRDQNSEERISLNTIMHALHEQGFCLLMIIFAFPSALPLPYPPGFTTILGIPLGLFSIQMLLGFTSPWLPKWLGEKTIKQTMLNSIVTRAIPLLHKAERFMKPRLSFMDSLIGEKLIGAICLFCAILISIPIPFGHALPGTGLLLISLGFLDRDGVTVIIGTLVAILGLFVDIAIIFIGTEALLKTISFLEQRHLP